MLMTIWYELRVLLALNRVNKTMKTERKKKTQRKRKKVSRRYGSELGNKL